VSVASVVIAISVLVATTPPPRRGKAVIWKASHRIQPRRCKSAIQKANLENAKQNARTERLAT